MPIGETASIADAVWAISSAVGLLVFVGLTWQAWRDYSALIRLGRNGGRKIAAWTAIGIQGGLATTQAIAVAIGVLRGVLPPAVPLKPATTTETLITVGLIASEALLVGVGVLTHVGRVRLLNYLESVKGQEGTTQHAESATQHAETMKELVHNTEVTTEARDGAQDAYHAANNFNAKLTDVQQEIAETNRVAEEVSEQLHKYTQQLEGKPKEREE